MSYFLGLQISQCSRGIYVTQTNYIVEVLNKFSMNSCKSIRTLLVTKEKLSIDKSSKLEEPSMFRSLIGSLLYICALRPELMFASSIEVVGLSDSDWSGCIDDSRKLVNLARIAPSISIDTEMECGRKENLGSQTLQRIAEQLQCYKTPSLIEELENITGHSMGSNFGTMDHVEGENGLFTHANWRNRRAAVLICLFEGKQGELRVILTKRSMKLSSHPGDVALPGGKMEEGDDDDSATALREAMEEIGLDSHLVQVVANLAHIRK
ncbi:uncharacterized protein LOC110420641 [Herrania umbratica]|uniref:Uncharacterized protein LOC110420641 n=1 Tax=Herrania umbratica TaxID=108875 RepID=A0A6J1ARV1_9ROSI|nr:uncharacterized protein LOC110420641 [Herrania umbratica]